MTSQTDDSAMAPSASEQTAAPGAGALAVDGRRSEHQPLPWAYILLVIVGLSWLGRELHTIVEPFLLAGFVSYLLHPMASWLERKRVPALIAYTLTVSVIGAAFYAFGAVIVDSIERFEARARDYQPNLDRIQASLTDLAHDLGLLAASEELSFEGLLNDFPEMAQAIVSSGTFFVLKAAAFVMVMSFFMVFMIHESHHVGSRLRLAFGEERAQRAMAITRELNADIQRYVVLKALVSLVTATLAYLILTAFQVEFAPILALVIFVFNFIPYIGSIAATILPGIVALLQFPSAWNALLVVSLITTVQQVLGNVWEPHLQGRKLNVSPLLILLALAYFGWVWGVVGMIVSVPLIAGLRLLLAQFPRTRFVAVLMSDAVIEANRQTHARESATEVV